MVGKMMKALWSLCLATALLPVQAQEVYYIHTDALGSPVAETDANRNVVARFEYEPYGRRLNASNDDKPGYTGHVMDAATGLVQMQQRYYDPGIGRFLSVDPVTANPNTGVNFNRYWYANNNPYKFTDPDGRAANFAIKFVIDVALEAGIQYATTGSVNVGEAVVEAGTGMLNPMKTVERARDLKRVVDRYRRADYRYRSSNPAAKATREAAEGKPCPKCGEPMVSGTKTAPQAQHEPSLSQKHYEGGGAEMSSADKKAYANSSESLDGANCAQCQSREGAAQRQYVQGQEKLKEK